MEVKKNKLTGGTMKRQTMKALEKKWKDGQIEVVFSTPNYAEIRWTRTNRKEVVEIIK